MGLLDRFFNPIWYRASKLDPNRQRIFSIVVGSYDFCRDYVQKELVSPLESFLNKSGCGPAVVSSLLAAEVATQLTDEALLGLFRCCNRPTIDPSGKLPPLILQGLPDVWGTFVLADINHRLKRASPTVLDDTHYSKDPDEARVQVLTKWMEILSAPSPRFVTALNASSFAEAWDGLAESMIGGMLTGLGRTPDDVVMSQARRVAAAVPLSRRALTEYFIERLAKIPLDKTYEVCPEVNETSAPRTIETQPSSQQTTNEASEPQIGAKEPWVYDPQYLLLHAIVGSLPHDQKRAYGLHLYGHSCRETAKTMSTSVEHVESLLREAQARVAEMRAARSNELVKGYIKFGKDGKASIVAGKDAGVVDFMHLFLVTFAHAIRLERRPPARVEVLERWLGITNQKWEPWHFGTFVSAYERFVWEGEALIPTLKFYNENLRKSSPTIEKTRLDVQTPAEVRAWFQDISGAVASSAPKPT